MLSVIIILSTTWQWYDPATDFNETMESGWDQLGDMYLPNADGLSAFRAGGNWDDGVHCGARALALGGVPWNVDSYIGSRGVCDPL